MKKILTLIFLSSLFLISSEVKAQYLPPTDYYGPPRIAVEFYGNQTITENNGVYTINCSPSENICFVTYIDAVGSTVPQSECKTGLFLDVYVKYVDPVTQEVSDWNHFDQMVGTSSPTCTYTFSNN